MYTIMRIQSESPW